MTRSQIDRATYENPEYSHARRYAEDKLAANIDESPRLSILYSERDNRTALYLLKKNG